MVVRSGKCFYTAMFRDRKNNRKALLMKKLAVAVMIGASMALCVGCGSTPAPQQAPVSAPVQQTQTPEAELLGVMDRWFDGFTVDESGNYAINIKFTPGNAPTAKQVAAVLGELGFDTTEGDVSGVGKLYQDSTPTYTATWTNKETGAQLNVRVNNK